MKLKTCAALRRLSSNLKAVFCMAVVSHACSEAGFERASMSPDLGAMATDSGVSDDTGLRSVDAGAQDSGPERDGGSRDAGTRSDLPPVGLPEACSPASSGTETLSIPSGSGIISFRLYIPPGYNCTPDQRYPVAIILHGLNGTTRIIEATVRAFEGAMQRGLTGPMIIAAPDGYRDSMWANDVAGEKPAQDDLMLRIRPYIASNYRTLEDDRYWTVQGFSMGGFGAMSLATSFPDRFGVALSFDGALHTYTTLSQNRQSIVEDIFGGEEAQFDLFSPYARATANVIQLRADSVALWGALGELDDYNTRFRAHLDGARHPVRICRNKLWAQLSVPPQRAGRRGVAFHLGATVELLNKRPPSSGAGILRSVMGPLNGACFEP